MISEEVEIVVYSFLNLLSLYTLENAISMFLNRKKVTNSLLKFVPYILYFIIGVFMYFCNKSAFVNSLFSIVLVIIISLNFEGNLKIRLTLAFLWTMFRIIIELFVTITYSKILNINLVTMLNNDILNIIGTSYVVIVTLMLIKLIQLIINKVKLYQKVTCIYFFHISIIPICSIIILYAFIEISLNYGINSWIIIISIMIIVFINVLFFYLFDRLKEMEKLKYDNELLKSQSEYYIKLEESINALFDKVRTIKHNLKHQLIYLKAKTQENTVNALEEVNNILDILIGEVLSEDLKEYTKNKNLNRLINYKVGSIYKNNIDVEIKVSVGVDTYIDENCMYIILGNAIDNAITNYSDEKSLEKRIVIRIVEDSNNLFIKISNPYNKKIFFKNGLPITSKADKSMHGIGLKSIKKLVEDKNGYFKIKTNNNVFSLEILLFDEIKQ